MNIKKEQLPHEAEAVLRDGEKKVKLTFAISHTIPRLGDFSLFVNPFADGEETDTFGCEFREELSGLLDNGWGETPSPVMEEHLVSEHTETADVTADGSSVDAPRNTDSREEILYRMMEQILDERKTEGEDEPDKCIMRCEGVMSRRDGDIVITYNDEQSEGMGETVSEIVLHGGRADMVSIVRTGAVSNVLVCEQGRRHISVYKTPVMPFEICVFAKDCEQNVTFDGGGTIRMNYYVELRGTEMQHTKMRVSVRV